FEELVVLDKAGRVHIPPEFLEHMQIQGRARLEVTEEGILIRRVEETAVASDGAQSDGEPEEQQKSGGLRGLFGRRKTGKKT
ncbi:MAG: ABC transporter ATP-binding protein, partial [Caldilinea sp.]|nr:ABC transporter ATP-binding protein [Caldilinea sp.]